METPAPRPPCRDHHRLHRPAVRAGADLGRILGDPPEAHRRAELLKPLEIITDPRGERYWQLVGVINDWPPYPTQVPTHEHVTAGLRAHGWVIAALRAHGRLSHDQNRGIN